MHGADRVGIVAAITGGDRVPAVATSRTCRRVWAVDCTSFVAGGLREPMDAEVLTTRLRAVGQTVGVDVAVSPPTRMCCDPHLRVRLPDGVVRGAITRARLQGYAAEPACRSSRRSLTSCDSPRDLLAATIWTSRPAAWVWRPARWASRGGCSASMSAASRTRTCTGSS